MTTASFQTAPAALTAILAGKAKITLVSTKTGARFTYKITRANASARNPSPLWFVSLLSGPNNEADFSYLGVIRAGFGNEGPRFSLTAKSTSTDAAPSVKAITWTVASLYNQGAIPAALEVWHEGSCCRCGRALTVPESIASGIGPECAKKGAKEKARLAA
jgi:hypothetical protein